MMWDQAQATISAPRKKSRGDNHSQGFSALIPWGYSEVSVIKYLPIIHLEVFIIIVLRTKLVPHDANQLWNNIFSITGIDYVRSMSRQLLVLVVYIYLE